MSEGLGRGFSRDVEAILNTVTLGAQLGITILFPHEIRENLRLAGMKLDQALPSLENPWAPPPEHEPDWGEPIGEDNEYDDPEEDVND